jgi:hypothetical protein
MATLLRATSAGDWATVDTRRAVPAESADPARQELPA